MNGDLTIETATGYSKGISHSVTGIPWRNLLENHDLKNSSNWKDDYCQTRKGRVCFFGTVYFLTCSNVV